MEVPWVSKATFVVCPRCNEPMLGYQKDWGEQDRGWEKPIRIFPPRDRDLHPSVPKAIQSAFMEARVCFGAKAFSAAAIMCRKTLEGICSAHGAKSKTLGGKLKELKEKGIIENRLFEWAEELRAIGNEAAHGVEFVASREDAEDTLQFTETLVEYIFTYRDRFEEFKKRRAERPPPTKEEDEF
jgi:Domain of unknown function (DUF4145)